MKQVVKEIDIFDIAGAFAQNKDVARDMRVNEIIPALDRKERIVLNFERVRSTTQSFVHALISGVIRKYGNDVLDELEFKSCNENVQQIIKIVAEYMQEGMQDEAEKNGD